MRAATILIIALLFFFLPSCNTAKKATEKESSHRELAAEVSQTTGTRETGAAFFDQAIIEQILHRYNIVVDFERWDFDSANHEETPTDSTDAPQTYRPEGAQVEKPPNAGLPKSYTKGSVNINAEGSQNRATQTSAGARVNKTDSTTTAANVEKKDDTKTETKQEEKTSSAPTAYVILLIVVGALIIFGRRK